MDIKELPEQIDTSTYSMSLFCKSTVVLFEMLTCHIMCLLGAFFETTFGLSSFLLLGAVLGAIVLFFCFFHFLCAVECVIDSSKSLFDGTNLN